MYINVKPLKRHIDSKITAPLRLFRSIRFSGNFPKSSFFMSTAARLTHVVSVLSVLIICLLVHTPTHINTHTHTQSMVVLSTGSICILTVLSICLSESPGVGGSHIRYKSAKCLPTQGKIFALLCFLEANFKIRSGEKYIPKNFINETKK